MHDIFHYHFVEKTHFSVITVVTRSNFECDKQKGRVMGIISS